MRRHAVVGAALLVLLLPSTLAAQDADNKSAGRALDRVRLAAGFGDYLGGLGLQGELLLLDRVSLVAGVGNPDDLEGTAAVRGYVLRRQHHEGFVGAGVGPLGTRESCAPAPVLGESPVRCSTLVPKGPSVRAGYRFEMGSGLSVEGMIGMGWIGWGVGPEHEIDQEGWDPIAGLTVGYGF